MKHLDHHFISLAILMLLQGWASTGQATLPGTLDTQYNPIFDGPVKTIAPLADGKALVGGAFTHVNGSALTGIVRLNNDGTVDETFNIGSGIDGTTNLCVNAIALQSDGKVLIGGNFTHINGTSRTNLARLNTDGTVDASFLSIEVDSINSLALQSDGKILYGNGAVGRLNTDGGPDPEFQVGNFFGYAHAWAFTPPSVAHIRCLTNGQILIQGFFATINNLDYYGLARLQANGTVDTNFACISQIYRDMTVLGGPISTTASLAVQADGKILVGSGAGIFGQWVNRRLLRLSSEGVVDESFPSLFPVDSYYIGNRISLVQNLDDGKILASGDFTTVAGEPRNHLARLTSGGELDYEFASEAGFDQAITAFGQQPDGMYLAGGAFTNANGMPRAYLARLYGDSPSSSLPVIVTPPPAKTVLMGQAVQLPVTAEGFELHYQWQHGTNAIAGATNSFLSLTNVQAADAGDYSVLVQNGAGQVTSEKAILTVKTLGDALQTPELSFTAFQAYWQMMGGGYWQSPSLGLGWHMQTNWTHNGAGGLQSDTLPRLTGDIIGASPIPYSVLKTTLQGPGTISFWWMASTSMELKVDDVTVLLIQLATNGLEEASAPISAGTHTLTWQAYCPDGALIALSDFRYVPETPSSAFSLKSPDYKADNGLHFQVSAPTDAVCQLERSEDLKTWTPWMTVSNIQSGLIINDPSATNRNRTFYRAVK